jgi:hypothetical protein
MSIRSRPSVKGDKAIERTETDFNNDHHEGEFNL